jgi:hypothetical protein
MKIEIKSQNFEGRQYFEFILQDGPGDRERVKGYATDLIIAFTKVIEWHERIEREYQVEKGIPSEWMSYDVFEAETPP